MLSHGSENLLANVTRTVLQPGDRVVRLHPSFQLNKDHTHQMEAQVELPLQGRMGVKALIDAAPQPVQFVVIANRINRAEVSLRPEDLREVPEAVHPDALAGLNEAQVEYAEGSDFVLGSELLATHDKPLQVLQTSSRAYGSAALQIADGLAGIEELRRGLELARSLLIVERLAQVAARTALADPQAVSDVVQFVQRDRVRV